MIKRGVAFLIFAIFCAAFFYYYWTGALIAHSATDMLATANGFLQDLGADRIDHAFTRASTNFRREHSPEQLRAVRDKYPLLKSEPTRLLREYKISRTFLHGTANYRALLQAGKETLPVELTLTTEEAAWKVDEVAFGAK